VLDVCNNYNLKRINLHEINLKFLLTLLILAICSVISNFLFFEVFTTDFLFNSIFIHKVNNNLIYIENLAFITKILIISFFGIFVSSSEYLKNNYIFNFLKLIEKNRSYIYLILIIGSFIMHTMLYYFGIIQLINITFFGLNLTVLIMYIRIIIRSIITVIFVEYFIKIIKSINIYYYLNFIKNYFNLFYNKLYYD
jgi:hypothetical protein